MSVAPWVDVYRAEHPTKYEEREKCRAPRVCASWNAVCDGLWAARAGAGRFLMLCGLVGREGLEPPTPSV